MYDNTNASPTNRVTLTGRISSEPRYSHEIYGEAFYEFSLEVKRLSDMADTLPVVVSERLLRGQGGQKRDGCGAASQLQQACGGQKQTYA